MKRNQLSFFIFSFIVTKLRSRAVSSRKGLVFIGLSGLDNDKINLKQFSCRLILELKVITVVVLLTKVFFLYRDDIQFDIQGFEGMFLV